MDIGSILAGCGIGGSIATLIHYLLYRAKDKEETGKTRAERIKTEDDILLRRNEYLKKEYEEQLKIIESYRQNHPENGKELDAWKEREEQWLQKQYNQERQIYELQKQLNFCLKEIDRLNKKK